MEVRPHAHPGSGDGEAAPARPKVVDIFRRHGKAYHAQHPLSPEQARLLRDMLACRTATLGGHRHVCERCGFERPVYHSCRNRGCPNCQALAQARWIKQRRERILPIGHYHVIFTLPEQLRPLAFHHPKEMYDLLFRAVSTTLQLLAKETLSAQLGITMVLHTWSRRMAYHPHIHCVVTAGGLTLDGLRWVDRKGYLFPVARMKALFRARVLNELQHLRDKRRLFLPQDEPDHPDTDAWARLVRSLPRKKRWNIFLQAPLGHSTHAIKYLGRYTHRIAISDARLISVDDHHVCFHVRDNEQGVLSIDEFIRRFLMHALPSGFRKIRHFGLYAPSNVTGRLQLARALLGPEQDGPTEDLQDTMTESWVGIMQQILGDNPLRCPQCKEGIMVILPLLTVSSRGPPPPEVFP